MMVMGPHQLIGHAKDPYGSIAASSLDVHGLDSQAFCWPYVIHEVLTIGLVSFSSATKIGQQNRARRTSSFGYCAQPCFVLGADVLEFVPGWSWFLTPGRTQGLGSRERIPSDYSDSFLQLRDPKGLTSPTIKSIKEIA